MWCECNASQWWMISFSFRSHAKRLWAILWLHTVCTGIKRNGSIIKVFITTYWHSIQARPKVRIFFRSLSTELWNSLWKVLVTSPRPPKEPKRERFCHQEQRSRETLSHLVEGTEPSLDLCVAWPLFTSRTPFLLGKKKKSFFKEFHCIQQ